MNYLSWVLYFYPKEMKKRELSSEDINQFVKDYINSFDEDEFIDPFYRLYHSFDSYQCTIEDQEYYNFPDKSYLLTRFVALSWSRANFLIHFKKSHFLTMFVTI